MNHQPNTPASINEAVARVVHRTIPAGHGTDACTTFDVEWLTIDPFQWSGDLYAAAGAAIDAREQEASVPPGDTFAYRLQELKRILKAPSPVAIQVCSRSFLRELIGRLDLTPSEALSPATVAQPVDQIVIGYTWTQFNGKHRSIGACPTEHAYSIEPIYYPLAQPCASQGCGGAVEEAVANVVSCWNRFRWSKETSDAVSALAALSTDKSGGAA